jgi:hypothetical protein
MDAGHLALLALVYLSHIGSACARWPRSLAGTGFGGLSYDGLHPARTIGHWGRAIYSFCRNPFVARISVFSNIPNFA